MHSTYLREYFPKLVENYSDDFLNTAKSTLIKNSPTENLGVGLIVREKDIDESYIRTYIEGYNAPITNTLEKLIENAFFSNSVRDSMVLGLPSPGSGYEGKFWFWLAGSNIRAKTFFNAPEPNRSPPPNSYLAQLRIVYDIDSDSFYSKKEYYQFKDKKDMYQNYTYALDKNMKATLVNTQRCIHDYSSNNFANDVTDLVSKLDPEIYKFQSYYRSDNGNTGIYIGLKNRK